MGGHCAGWQEVQTKYIGQALTTGLCASTLALCKSTLARTCGNVLKNSSEFHEDLIEKMQAFHLIVNPPDLTSLEYGDLSDALSNLGSEASFVHFFQQFPQYGKGFTDFANARLHELGRVQAWMDVMKLSTGSMMDIPSSDVAESIESFSAAIASFESGEGSSSKMSGRRASLMKSTSSRWLPWARGCGLCVLFGRIGWTQWPASPSHLTKRPICLPC